ncbi:MAG: sigma-70 family RNA polymerase sigma factor [Firmicutes bacterium]|nr:sigma-70 family RNA polymerase sigma factor [Bacillota bacterium]
MNYFNLIQYQVDNFDKINIDFQKAKEGDTNEQLKLILKYLRLIKKISTISGKIDEDLMQEIIIDLLVDILPGYDEKKGDFGKRLGIIAGNKKKNYLKYLHIRKHNSIDEKIEDGIELKDTLIEDINLENQYINKETRKKLFELISQLKPKHQYMVNKYYLKDPPLTLKEIGQQLGYSHEYVRQELKKVRLYLKRKML